MKTKLWIFRLLCLMVLSLIGNVIAAQFETDFGLPNNNESYQDGIRISRGRALTLVNTNLNNSTSLLLSRHRLTNGNTLTTTNIFSNEWRLQGHSLGIRRNFFWFPRSYYVTGIFKDDPSDIQTGVFILRTNAACVPTHFFRRPGDPAQANITRGMAVENYRRWSFFIGDTRPQIVTGNQNLDFHGFWVSRFRSGNNMAVDWSFRYFLTGDHWNNSITAKGSCLGTYRTSNGSLRAGIAVTGSYSTLDRPVEQHTFVSMIDRNTGTEIWRTACPSELRIDQGVDIVYDSSQGRYFVVGFSRDDNHGTRVYTAIVRNDGTFLGSSIHNPGPGANFRNMIARSVCLSLNKGHAVITGFIEVIEQGDPVPRAFAVEVAIQPNTVSTWANYYQESLSDIVGIRSTETIRPLRRRARSTRGYLITTGGQLIQKEGSSRDAQLIKIEPDGTLGSVGCKVIGFELESNPQQATRPEFNFRQENYPWVRTNTPLHQRINLSTTFCED